MKTLWALALIAPLAACATITRGTTQAFTVESEPSGAQVVTSTGMSCEATPCTFARVPRNSEFTVTISKDGYRTTEHNVTHEISGGGAAGMAGNVLVGGLIGAGVDATSGAMNDLTPNPLRVTLERLPPPALAEASATVAPAAADAAAPAEVPEEETAAAASPSR